MSLRYFITEIVRPPVKTPVIIYFDEKCIPILIAFEDQYNKKYTKFYLKVQEFFLLNKAIWERRKKYKKHFWLHEKIFDIVSVASNICSASFGFNVTERDDEVAMKISPFYLIAKFLIM